MPRRQCAGAARSGRSDSHISPHQYTGVNSNPGRGSHGAGESNRGAAADRYPGADSTAAVHPANGATPTDRDRDPGAHSHADRHPGADGHTRSHHRAGADVNSNGSTQAHKGAKADAGTETDSGGDRHAPADSYANSRP